jgi:hypothetical protein
LSREILHACSKFQSDTVSLRDGVGEGCLQIGPMDHPKGRAVALRSRFAKWHTHDFPSGAGVKHAQSGGGNHLRPQLFLHTQADQYAHRIGRELNAGAGLFQALDLLKDDDTKSLARKRQRRSQSADAGASDNDRARRRQVLLRGSLR